MKTSRDSILIGDTRVSVTRAGVFAMHQYYGADGSSSDGSPDMKNIYEVIR